MTIVGLLVGGVFYLGNAVLDVDGAARILVALAGIAYTVVMPTLVWRTLGPRPTMLADGAAA